MDKKNTPPILFWLQLPLIAIAAAAFGITELGAQGKLESPFLREKLYPTVSRISNIITDFKFKMRGPQAPKNKVVIVEVDSQSIEAIGRWPWHRDVQSFLIHKIFENGAKVVGLDIIFSEPDQRVPDELAKILQAKKMGGLIDQFETDKELERVIAAYKDRLVMGWTSESVCQPLYSGAEGCPITHPDAIASLPANFDKFSYQRFNTANGYDPLKSPFISFPTLIASIPAYNAAATHSAYLNGFQDSDGYIRKTSLFMMANGKPYPSMAMEMARIAMGQEIELSLDERQRVKELGFVQNGQKLPVTPTGAMEINFRGPGRTFTYIPAIDLLREGDAIQDEVSRKLAGASKKELLQDALVLVGLSAIGVFDMRAFPFDGNAPGVEIHANILDNLLSNDPMLSGASGIGSWMILLLMIGGALVFARYAQKWEAVPALLLFLAVFAGVGVVDLKVLFANNRNWNLSFFYLEIMAIFIFTIAVKYVLEEKNKKFIKGAFAKYVAPAVVDSILKDPTKLSVGGVKKELTIMFSDIRSFTTFSEKLDAKTLAALLNEYLGAMTKIVFANEGTLDKYIGDAIMAFWGAPLDQPKHAGNACRAAIQMMQKLAEEKPKYKAKYGVDVNIGVGINSGMVNVGNMGSEDNFAFTVIGDHVNLSSRLEGLTKYYAVSILTTRFTFDDILAAGEQLPPHRVLDHVKVKGKKTAVEIIQVCENPLAPEGLALFEKARALYAQQKWDEATAAFKEAGAKLAVGGEPDGPTQMYIDRIVEMKANPPGADWDGSWEMHSK